MKRVLNLVDLYPVTMKQTLGFAAYYVSRYLRVRFSSKLINIKNKNVMDADCEHFYTAHIRIYFHILDLVYSGSKTRSLA